MKKANFKEYDMSEFENNFVYGLQPVLDGQSYHHCQDSCTRPKRLSERASGVAQGLMDEFYEKCLIKTK